MADRRVLVLVVVLVLGHLFDFNPKQDPFIPTENEDDDENEKDWGHMADRA